MIYLCAPDETSSLLAIRWITDRAGENSLSFIGGFPPGAMDDRKGLNQRERKRRGDIYSAGSQLNNFESQGFEMAVHENV